MRYIVEKLKKEDDVEHIECPDKSHQSQWNNRRLQQWDCDMS